MKSLIDFVLTMLEDYKEKEYISSRDIVNHLDEKEYHRGKNTAYKEVLDYLNFTLKQKSLSKMELVQKEITELFSELAPMARSYVAATLKRYIKDEDTIIAVTYSRYDGDQFYQSGSKRKSDGNYGTIDVEFTFESIAKFLVANASDTQSGSAQVVVEHKLGYFTMEMDEMLTLHFETDELPF